MSLTPSLWHPRDVTAGAEVVPSSWGHTVTSLQSQAADSKAVSSSLPMMPAARVSLGGGAGPWKKSLLTSHTVSSAVYVWVSPRLCVTWE